MLQPVFPQKADTTARLDRKLFIWILKPEQNWNKKGKAIDHVGPAEEPCETHLELSPQETGGGGTEPVAVPCTGQGACACTGLLHLGEH